MSESGDYTPAPHWRGASNNFVSARRSYASVADRSYSEAVDKGVDVSDLCPEEISTDCEAPLVIAIDVTASMGEWPITIFSKLPYLEHEGQEYLGDDMEISFAAIGDSQYDRYPLQVREFVKGAKLKKELEGLVHEKGGGGNQQESYDLAALYYSRNCKTDGAIRKPIFIFIGDEGVYDPDFSPKAEALCHTKIDGRSTPKSAFNALKETFNVYVIRKSYGGGDSESSIQKQWETLLGKDHVIALQAPERVVDVIFGILAKETGRIEYFEEELEDRQGKDTDGDKKIAIVLKSLHSVHKGGKAASLKKIAGPKGGGKSKSVAVKKVSSKTSKKKKPAKSVSLLDD